MAATIISRKLDLLGDKARQKVIPWDGYARGGLLSTGDVALVQKVSNGKTAVELDADKEGSTYAQLYVKLLSLNRNDTIAYVLVLMGDMIADHDERIPLFIQASPYDALIQLLNSSDEFIRLKSASLLAIFLSQDSDAPKSSICSLYNGLNKLLKLSAPEDDWDLEVHGIVIQAYATVFRKQQGRHELWRREKESSSDPKVFEGLITILKAVVHGLSSQPVQDLSSNGTRSGTATPNTTNSTTSGISSPPPQLQYNLGLAFWIAAYDKEIASNLASTYTQFIPLMTELARNTVKEKIARIVLATFRNLVTLAPKENLPVLLSSGLLPLLRQFASTKKWSDEEVKEDVEYLKEQLEDVKKGLTTFDEYEQEVESGLLTWSTPTHEDDEFWRENAKKLENKDKKVLKSLLEILRKNKDATPLAISCNDLGQYMKNVENGRKTVTDLGGKPLVMQLMTHPDPDVKFRALIAVQRLVSHTWKA